MGIEKEFEPVKLFSGFIYREETLYQAVKQQLEQTYSPIDLESPVIPFDFTSYYHPEMGAPLSRRFASFTRLIQPGQLPEIKLTTNQVEIDTAHEGKRRINLDPGYLSEANVIIATTKNYYHRVPLANGIYAHMEYVIKGSNFVSLEWTYPDFKSQAYLDFFQQLRLIYKKSMKEFRKQQGE